MVYHAPKKRSGKYDGKPCVHGRGTLRYVAGKSCVVCHKLNAGRRFRADPEAWRAQRRATYCTDEGRADRRERNLFEKYGMTPADHAAMLAAQGGRCAVCSVEATAVKTKFHVDHNHDTGAVRALLCQRCNVAIGLCEDDPRRLEQAAAYLRKHGHAKLRVVA